MALCTGSVRSVSHSTPVVTVASAVKEGLQKSFPCGLTKTVSLSNKALSSPRSAEVGLLQTFLNRVRIGLP